MYFDYLSLEFRKSNNPYELFIKCTFKESNLPTIIAHLLDYNTAAILPLGDQSTIYDTTLSKLFDKNYDIL